MDDRVNDYWLSKSGQSPQLVDSVSMGTDLKHKGEQSWLLDAFDAVLDPIFIHDHELRVMRANKAYAALAGIDVSEIRGQYYWHLFPKGDKAVLNCGGTTLQNTASHCEELTLDNGKTYRSRSFAKYGENGKHLYSVHILEDVTERKRSDEALIDATERLKQAQAVAHLGSWELDLMQDELWWSEETYRIFDVQPGMGIRYETFLELVHPDDRGFVHRSFRETVENGALYNIEYRLLTKDGSVKWVNERCKTDYDNHGRQRAVGTVQDITEIKENYEHLRRSNRALHALSTCNSILIHAASEEQLLQNMCQALIDRDGYRLAWIGFVEHDEHRSIRPVAFAGYENGYLKDATISWGDGECGQSPVGRAVRLGAPQIAQDIMSDEHYAPWREQALKRGYASSIVLPLKNGAHEVFAVMCIYAAECNAFDEHELALLCEMAEDIAFGITTLRTIEERDHYQTEHLKSAERLKEALVSTIRAITATVEKRDPYTGGHQSRVAQLCVAIARELKLDEEFVEGLRMGAMIHDIGKIYVPSEILNRPGSLTTAEHQIIRSHVEVGYDIIKDVKFPWPVAEMVLQHHERLDGSGYPRGLKGEQINLQARILAVADVVEAITAHRPYRPALGIEAAVKELEQKRDLVYDAEVTDACLTLIRDRGFTFDSV